MSYAFLSRRSLHAALFFFAFLSLMGPLKTEAALTDGLVGHWRLDEGSGTTVIGFRIWEHGDVQHRRIEFSDMGIRKARGGA